MFEIAEFNPKISCFWCYQCYHDPLTTHWNVCWHCSLLTYMFWLCVGVQWTPHESTHHVVHSQDTYVCLHLHVHFGILQYITFLYNESTQYISRLLHLYLFFSLLVTYFVWSRPHQLHWWVWSYYWRLLSEASCNWRRDMSARYPRHCWPRRIQVGGVDGVCVCVCYTTCLSPLFVSHLLVYLSVNALLKFVKSNSYNMATRTLVVITWGCPHPRGHVNTSLLQFKRISVWIKRSPSNWVIKQTTRAFYSFLRMLYSVPLMRELVKCSAKNDCSGPAKSSGLTLP